MCENTFEGAAKRQKTIFATEFGKFRKVDKTNRKQYAERLNMGRLRKRTYLDGS